MRPSFGPAASRPPVTTPARPTWCSVISARLRAEPMIDIASGHAKLDAFLADGYLRIRGMSSRFAAAICGHAMGRQSELGITGDILEIGTFEGRFFIAMALLLEPGEHALGIDVFNWPDQGVHGR